MALNMNLSKAVTLTASVLSGKTPLGNVAEALELGAPGPTITGSQAVIVGGEPSICIRCFPERIVTSRASQRHSNVTIFS